MSLTPSFINLFFFFQDTATTEIYTLSLHDALPICHAVRRRAVAAPAAGEGAAPDDRRDRKSTRLNSSHQIISYAVFCLKKKNIYNVGHDRSVPQAANESPPLHVEH